MSFIQVNEPLLDGNEKKYLAECIDTGWISSEGPFVRRLEEGFAARVGRRHGVAVCNGSVALDLAVEALGIGEGDEVILPSLTIISCGAAIARSGARPVAVDCDPLTWNMDVSKIERRITPRTKAIMVVHLYGLPVDMDPVLEIARRHGLKVIEDAAEVHGQDYRGRACGSFGDISTFSFYPNKHITTGEGGMVMCDDPGIAKRVGALKNLCLGVGPARFVHEDLGWNFRLSNLQAAVGVAQLERLDQFVERKRAMGRRYQEILKGVPGLQLPLERTDYSENIYWVFGLVLDDAVRFDAWEAIERMSQLGVGCRPFFWPMHEQPVFKKRGWFEGESLPVSSRLARRGFYLPSGLALTAAQQERVGDAVRQLMERA
jgi:perosamine synthetase